MMENSWFRVDRKRSKWHLMRNIVDGATSARVFFAHCGAALGDSPDREPRALTTTVEPTSESSCKRCMKIGVYL